ncbi:PIG-L family deacetylase [bacterium]|nr:PIG-L family deacetylase [bacterium]
MGKHGSSFIGITFLVMALVFCVTAPASGQKASATPPDDGKLNIIAFGAHPDDCELKAGGVAMLWAKQGHHVKFVSVTNGDIGHWKMAGGPLAQRRADEVHKAAEMFGIVTEVLDNHDGELMPTLENRKIITRLIREWKADIVLAPRTNDYHPDHRYTGILVQDAAFMVTVPFFCPDTPHLTKNPVFMYFSDGFQKPAPFKPDIVVSTDDVIDTKLAALAQMESQFVEAGVSGNESMIPKNETERAAAYKRVSDGFRRGFVRTADQYRDLLTKLYGEEKGKNVKTAEAFEVCEYGRRPSEQDLKKLFPFFGQ